MANPLGMDKSLAINQLHDAGYSQRRIAITLKVSRGAVKRHLAENGSNSTTAPTGSEPQAPTGSDDPNSTTAPTESGDLKEPSATATSTKSNSSCEPFRQQILEMLEQGLHARRIHQDLVDQYDFTAKY